jgi:lysophospholipase L1-like esterase
MSDNFSANAKRQVIKGLGFSIPITTIIGQALPVNETRARLAQHMSVIQAFGYTDISAIGRLKISRPQAGQSVSLLQKTGVLFPPKTRPIETTEVFSGTAVQTARPGVFQGLTRGVPFTNAQNLVMPTDPKLASPVFTATTAAAHVIPIGVAYWFGTEIVLEDNSVILLDSDVKSLVIIAETLTVGQNVSISWVRPPATSAAVPTKPATPPDWEQATSVGSERGRDGSNGIAGGQGPHGQPAPEIELWFLQSTGFPAIDLRGQDGFVGVKGGDGGDGGRGQKGCNTEKKNGFCSQEQGPGGDGGNGGRAGDGGRGGDGGTGGKFTVFAPQTIINAWFQGGLTISVDGGNAGAGGDAGRPGEGGPGGQKGDKLHSVCPNNSRQDGTKGNTGASGARGPDGQKGLMLNNSIRYSAIDPSDFLIELAKPAIVSLTPQTAFVGDTISVNGLRFAQGDKVFIEGFDGQINVACATTFVSQTLLTFKVPSVPGGYALLEVVQTDGTRSSSRGTLLIRPRIDAVIPAGRVRPGEYYFLRGEGLGRSGNIWINGEGIGSFESVDNNTIKFKARRPSNAEINEAGEHVKLKVVNAEGAGQTNPNHSAEIDIVLDTYRMLVFGDSVMWGGGLHEHLKYYSLAADYVAARMENAGVYRTNEAHHGAKIGRGDSTVKDEMPGEMSSRWPTILQQVDSLSSISDAAEVDLILLDGGANDLPITDVMMKTPPSQLEAAKANLIIKVHEYCFDDMVFMLQKVCSQFPKARVIVTGYYRIVSEESDQSFAQQLLLALIDDPTKPLWEDSVADTHNKAIALSNLWAEEANKNLSNAVQSINNSLSSDPRVFFVNPEFTARNAAHAPESLLWEPDAFGGPTDPMWKGGREQQRDVFEARLKSEPSTLMDGYFITKRNSSYHPNPAGAQRYFEKMQPVLDLATKAKRVALRCSTGHYLCAEGGGNGALVANRLTLGPWETFELIDLGNSLAALKSVNGLYICAENGGGQNISVNRVRLGGWETFTLVPQGPGVAFKTATGHFLSAVSGGGGGMVASATQIAGGEVFRVL